MSTRTSDKTYRVATIKRRAIPELLNAWESGHVSLKSAYRFSTLTPQKQRVELAQYSETRATNNERQAAWRAKPKRARSPYASSSYEECRARRLRRIQRYAIPELIASLERGELSLRAAEIASRLPRSQQRIQLVNRLQSQQQKAAGERLAAVAIAQFLQTKDAPLSSLTDWIVKTIRGESSI